MRNLRLCHKPSPGVAPDQASPSRHRLVALDDLPVRRNDSVTLSRRDALLFAQFILTALCEFIGSRRSISFD
jgi:hypothetical protein